MTIGTGIFLSTILLVLVFAIRQATRHQKWKIIGKVAAISAVVCIAVGGCWYAWTYVSNLPPSPSVVTELADVKLGMAPTDVKLVLGAPQTLSNSKLEKNKLGLQYDYTAPAVTIVFFGADETHLRASIICTDDPNVKMRSFDNLANKDSIVRSLGKPDSVSVSNDGLSELISYTKWNVAFQLSKNRVTDRCVATGKVGFVEAQAPASTQPTFDTTTAKPLTPVTDPAILKQLNAVP